MKFDVIIGDTAKINSKLQSSIQSQLDKKDITIDTKKLKINLLKGDCTELLKTIPSDSVHMILCDLPYGMTQNSWDEQLDLNNLWAEYWRILKSNGVVALTASQPFTSMLVCSQLENFRHEWIWIKNKGSNFANTIREPMKEHESVLIFSKGQWTYNNQMQERSEGGANRVKYSFNTPTESQNYRKFDRITEVQGELRVPSSWQKFNCEVGLHPTQKPVDLMKYFIKTYTNPGDTVLDNCMGSGTTGVAAVQLGRNFIGMELKPEFYEIAHQRIFSLL